MPCGILDEWFVRFTSVSSGTLAYEKAFTLNDLLVEQRGHNDKGRPSDPSRKSDHFLNGGVVLGRRGSVLDGDKHTFDFHSPIMSRAHAQLNVTPHGHVYLTDLNSLHGTCILTAETLSRATTAATGTIRLRACSPIQLCGGDTILFGKPVVSGDRDFQPVEVRVIFRYPTFAEGSNAGLRTILGPTTSASAEGKFASFRHVERLRNIVMATTHWKLVQRQLAAMSKAARSPEYANGHHNRVLEASTRPKTFSPEPGIRQSVQPILSSHSRMSSPDYLRSQVEHSVRQSGYRVPQSVLYQSDDELNIPRNSEQVIQGRCTSHSATRGMDDDVPGISSCVEPSRHVDTESLLSANQDENKKAESACESMSPVNVGSATEHKALDLLRSDERNSWLATAEPSDRVSFRPFMSDADEQDMKEDGIEENPEVLDLKGKGCKGRARGDAFAAYVLQQHSKESAVLKDEVRSIAKSNGPFKVNHLSRLLNEHACDSGAKVDEPTEVSRDFAPDLTVRSPPRDRVWAGIDEEYMGSQLRPHEAYIGLRGASASPSLMPFPTSDRQLAVSHGVMSPLAAGELQPAHPYDNESGIDRANDATSEYISEDDSDNLPKRGSEGESDGFPETRSDFDSDECLDDERASDSELPYPYDSHTDCDLPSDEEREDPRRSQPADVVPETEYASQTRSEIEDEDRRSWENILVGLDGPNKPTLDDLEYDGPLPSDLDIMEELDDARRLLDLDRDSDSDHHGEDDLDEDEEAEEDDDEKADGNDSDEGDSAYEEDEENSADLASKARKDVAVDPDSSPLAGSSTDGLNDLETPNTPPSSDSDFDIGVKSSEEQRKDTGSRVDAPAHVRTSVSHDTSMETEAVPPTPESRPRSDSISNASSTGPITPLAGRKRHLPDELLTTSSADEAEARPVKRPRRIASSIGLIMLGAALGSVGTIAGLMQLAD